MTGIKIFKYPPNGRCESCNTKFAKPGGCVGCMAMTAYFNRAWFNNE